MRLAWIRNKIDGSEGIEEMGEILSSAECAGRSHAELVELAKAKGVDLKDADIIVGGEIQ